MNYYFLISACTGLQFVADGIYKSFGLFNVKLLEKFNEIVSLTTLIMGIMNGVYCITGNKIVLKHDSHLYSTKRNGEHVLFHFFFVVVVIIL